MLQSKGQVKGTKNKRACTCMSNSITPRERVHTAKYCRHTIMLASLRSGSEGRWVPLRIRDLVF